jgi:hypothetical protein
MIDERTSSRYMWDYGCNIAMQECAWLYVGLSVVMSKQEGVVMLGGLRQDRVFVSMSSIILA